MNKKLIYGFLVVIVLILIALGVDYHKKKHAVVNTEEGTYSVTKRSDKPSEEVITPVEEEEEEVQVPGKDITLKGSSCGKDCTEYKNIDSKMDESAPETGDNNNTYYIKDGKVSIIFGLYTNSTIKYNNKQIFKEKLVPSYVKILKYNDYTVVHFETNMTQCSSVISLFIDKNGNVTKIDDLNKEKITIGKEKIRPSIYYVEYNKDEIVVYKRACLSGNPDKKTHIGFKYTYELNGNKFNLKKTTKLYK